MMGAWASPIACVLLCALPAMAAEKHCPWLTDGTAAALLGGAVVAQVETMDDTTGRCSFSRVSDAGSYKLDVSVKKMRDTAAEFPTYLAACGTEKSPLRGIGNEAFLCGLPGSTAKGNQVVGRTRDNAFIVIATVTEQAASQVELRSDVATRAAEQVAGYLF